MTPANDNTPSGNFTAYEAQLAAGDWSPAQDPDGHPFRTNTRFQRRDDGQWLAIVPAQASRKDEPATDFEARRKRIAVRVKAERRAMAPLLRKLRVRQEIGDPSCVQSRAEDWPLAEALRRHGLDDYLDLAIRYPQLVAVCECQPLQGADYGASHGMAVERRSKRLDGVAEVEAAAANEWAGNVVPGGEIEYRSEIKRSQGAYAIPAKRKQAAPDSDALEPAGILTESIAVKFSEALLIERIDAKPRLATIRAALGPLLEPFEDAALGGRTFAEIGRSQNEKSRPEIAGKALVFRALAAASGEFARMDRRTWREAA